MLPHLELDSTFNTIYLTRPVHGKKQDSDDPLNTTLTPALVKETTLVVIVTFSGSRGGTDHSMGVHHLLTQGITEPWLHFCICGAQHAILLPSTAARTRVGPGKALSRPSKAFPPLSV